MTNVCAGESEQTVKTEDREAVDEQAGERPEPEMIEVERSGEWMSLDELKESVLKATKEKKDITIDLNHIDHLDSSALQILLALEAEQKKQQRVLHLVNGSAHLHQWFEYAGAAGAFSHCDWNAGE